METEKNQEEMMKELDAKIAELNKLKEELGQNITDAKADAKDEATSEDETFELCDDPLKWWQGAIVLGIPAVLGFVGGVLAGVGIAKKD